MKTILSGSVEDWSGNEKQIYREKGCVPARKSVALWSRGAWPQRVKRSHEEAQEYVVGQSPCLERSGVEA